MSRAAGVAARRAAQLIALYGWTQMGWGSTERGYCIRGAFNVVTWGMVGIQPSPQEQEFTDWLRDLGVAPKDKPLEDWNDQSARTKEEVLVYLNKFAEEQDPQARATIGSSDAG